MFPAEFVVFAPRWCRTPSHWVTMNSCRRITRVGDWTFGLNRLFSSVKPRTNRRRSAEAAASQRRGQATDAREKPRLRAIDLARKIQQEKEKPQRTEAPLSAQEKRVMELKRFSAQLQNVHPNVLAKQLHRSILYQNKDVVITTKPYGVPVGADNSSNDSKVTSISSVLPVLSKMMDGMKIKSDSRLLLCPGPDKEMTGVLLLARSEEAVERILNLHKNNEIQTKYWVVTVGEPVPSEGVIDIPMIERQVTGNQPHYKMGLSPLFKMNDAGDGLTKIRTRNRHADAAVTKYRVLDSSGGCSLVELQPFTRVKHQLRVHMAFGLACPILGDHKYSHWSKLAPQKLPEHVLGKLGLEQSKVRYLPLHLHARQLTLPGAGEADIDVSCPLPKYFTHTLKKLQLQLPEKKR